jgi:hypothetical protein
MLKSVKLIPHNNFKKPIDMVMKEWYLSNSVISIKLKLNHIMYINIILFLNIIIISKLLKNKYQIQYL